MATPVTRARARLLAALFVSALLLPLAGCGGDQTGQDTTDNSVTSVSPSPQPS
ncbi:MAG TPA: hypothetical protein VKP64_07405 [Mycobacteriales bacterium]|nr:hypothetical protein [Mycobacteriales bacterium]